MPATRTSVCVGVVMLMPSGALNTTGCEKPSDRLRSLPWAEARYPTPTSSSLRSKPWETPWTMLATMERRVPARAICPGSSAENSALPSSIVTWMWAGLAIDSVPLGPLTLISSDCALSSTPLGRATGFLAMRDMRVTPLGHEAQDFAADALLARLRVGHDALGGGDDGDAEATQDLGQRVLAAVLTQTGARVALHLVDHRTAFEILEDDLELGLGAVLGHAQVADVA